MHKFQYLYFNKIIAVIRSCRDEVQLENTRTWFDRVALINKLPHFYAYKIAKAYKDKKRQIRNGLATKYN